MRSSRLPHAPSWLCVLLLVVLVLSALPARTPVGSASVRIQAVPQTVVLQPDAANGTDTAIRGGTPAWNYGDNASLWVGRNLAPAGVDRSLLAFNPTGLPGTATILNATLELYQSSGGAGSVQVRRAFSPWLEGPGGGPWTSVDVTVRETAGVNRTREPVVLTVPFGPGYTGDPARDLRVWGPSGEVPSQVYGYTYSGSEVTSARVAFGATVGAYQTESFAITYSANGSAVPVYRLRSWGPSAAWTYLPSGATTPWGASGASVADLDGDGRLEIVFGGNDGYVYCLNETGGLMWRQLVSATTSQSIPFTPQIVDMNRSGRPSIVVVTNDPAIARLDYRGNINWKVSAPAVVFSIPTLVDANRDGTLDVVFGGNTNQVFAFDGRNGAQLPQTYPVGLAGYTASIADVNGDGQPDILFPGDDKTLHAYALNAAVIWSASSRSWTFLEGSVALGDVNGDGQLDAVSGDDANNGVVFAVYANNGTTLWVGQPTAGYREGGQTLADLFGDGQLEVLFGSYTSNSGPVYSMSGVDGTILWTQDPGNGQAGTPAVVDLDRSGTPDVVFQQGPAILVYDRSGALLHTWTITENNLDLRNLAQHPMTTPAIVDLLGDGTLDVIAPTGDGVKAFVTGSLDRDWRTWGYNWNHTNLAWDGNSPDGASFLQVTLGTPQAHAPLGATWTNRDGPSAWATAGGDFGAAEATAVVAGGWNSWNVTGIVQDWVDASFPNLGFVLTEADESSGPFHALTSSDGAVPSLRPRLTVIYVELERAPTILGRIPDVSRPENSPPFTIDLAAFTFDPDTPAISLRWNVSAYDPSVIQITGLNTPGNQLLTVYPQANAWGHMLVRYWLTDPEDNSDWQDAWINITHVNQPPAFNPPSVLYVQSDVPFSFNFGPYIEDPDTPRNLLSFASNDTVHTTVAGFNATFLYPSAFLNRWAFVTLTVGDGEYSVPRVVVVKVTSDSPPVLTRALPDITMMEGETILGVFDLDDYFADPNDDALYFSFGYSHLNITIQANHSVDVTAQAEWWGVESVTFRATDPTGAMQEDTITVTVMWIDDPPSIGPVPDLRVRYDTPYSFNVGPYLSDPDTPMDQLRLTVSTAYASVSLHLVTFLYPAFFNNTVQNVTITVSDGLLNASRMIRVTIGDDYPPILITGIEDRSFAEDTILSGAYNLSAFFTDPDGNTLYYSAGNQNVTVSINAWGNVSLGAAANWWGVERVTFRAEDPQGALAEDTVWITVTAVDDAPYFLPIPTQYVNATTAYVDLGPYLADIDTPRAQLSVYSTYSSALAIGQGILLNFTQDGTYYVEVRVDDGTLSNTTTVTVIVALPAPQVLLQVPAWVYWLPLPIVAVAAAAFIVYRRRKLEWALLMTHAGILVSSVSRQAESDIDTDLITSMLTAIMDFAHTSFSDERERHLDGLQLGEKRVAIAKGSRSYLAVVYRGRTPGGLIRIMHSLLQTIEKEHADALRDVVDTSKLGDIPVLLQRLMTRGSLPFAFVSFRHAEAQKA